MKARSILSLCFLGAAGFDASRAVAQTGGSFAATGNMAFPRVQNSATLLPDGRVLIAGGSTSTIAELFDPSTGTFSATGNMTVLRSGHSATLLPNGTVLIAGGDAAGHSAELYDPKTGTFTSTGMIDDPGESLTATLPDGRILFVYGAKIYDPSTGAFTSTGRPLETPEGGGDDTATSLTDGTVLLTQPNELRGELYEPGTGTYRITFGIRDPWVEGSATVLLNGEVLLAGGFDPYLIESSLAELYAPSEHSNGSILLAGQWFMQTGSLTVARANHTATLLPDGTVLIAGAWGDDGNGIPFSLPSAELYDSAASAFTRTGDMNVSRGYHTATLLNNGKVLITGGVTDYTFKALSSAELYTPTSVIPAPVLFSLSGNGQGPGAIWHSTTGAIVSARQSRNCRGSVVYVHVEP
jgi:hypothetical protein